MVHERTVLLLAVALVLSVGAVSVVAATPTPAPVSDAPPGERMAGIVDTHDAELESEVDERAFGIAIAQAETDEAQADIVADRLQRNADRLAAIEERLATLQTQRETGEISESAYEARVARLEVERQSVERTTNDSLTVAGGLPSELLEERGINVTAIETLRQNASELGGQEVREIARSIAGDGVGASPTERPNVADRMAGQAAERVEQAESGEDAVGLARLWVDRADRQVDTAEQRVDLVDAPDGVSDALSRANAELDAAHEALESAESALEAGDDDRAAEYAALATEHASNAVEAANDALDLLRGDGPGPGDRPGR